MVGITGDMSALSNKWNGDKDVTKWHVRYKLVRVMVHRCRINCIVKCSDKLRAIVCIVITVIIN